MDTTRRTLCLSLPALAATAALAADRPLAPIPSFAKPFDTLPVHQNGANTSRAILDGTTHSNDHMEVHETTLAPGSSPHPPHQHAHEELFLMMQGTLAVTSPARPQLSILVAPPSFTPANCTASAIPAPRPRNTS